VRWIEQNDDLEYSAIRKHYSSSHWDIYNLEEYDTQAANGVILVDYVVENLMIVIEGRMGEYESEN
jgi:hypothetical protein